MFCLPVSFGGHIGPLLIICHQNSVLLVFIIALLVTASDQICDTEISEVYDQRSSVEWTYNYYENDQIVFSTPTCLDSNKKAVSRICHNGSWYPPQPPICQTVSNNEYCPHNFFEKSNFCIALIEESSFRFNLTKQQGVLQYINTSNIPTYSCEYLDEFVDKEFNDITTEYSQMQCCRETDVLNSKTEFCNSTYYVLEIPNDHQFYLCPDNCVSAGLGSNICFCKTTSDTEKLAVIDSPLTREIATSLADNDYCKVADTFKILNLNHIVTKNFFGLYPENTSCYIVQRGPLVLPDVETTLYLNFDEYKRKLYLIIYNSQNVSPSKEAVSCYTDASDDLIKKANIKKKKVIKNKNFEYTTIYKVKLENYIGQYWCYAYLLNLTKIESNTALATKTKEGNEYALRFEIFNKNNDLNLSNNTSADELKNLLSLELFNYMGAELRIMHVFNLTYNYADILVHLSTLRNRNIIGEYFQIYNQFPRLPDYLTVKNFRSVNYCLPETTIKNGSMLNWGLTEIMDSTTPEEICLTNQKIPLVRICSGNFLEGAEWTSINGTCSKDIKIPNTTIYLHNNLKFNVTKELITNFTEVVKTNLSTYDIFLLSNLIKKINDQGVQDDEITNGIFNIINEITKNKESLFLSQLLLNATDKILMELDKYIAKNVSTQPAFTFSQENILVVILYPFKTNISGLYLLGDNTSTLNKLDIKYLNRNDSIKNIPVEDLESLQVATYVPEKILEDVEIALGSSKDIKIIFTVFYKDSLFVSPEEKAANKVISIIIPGYGIYLNNSLPIVMRSQVKSSKCGFWNYGQELQRSKGKWSTYGGKFGGELKEHLYICLYSHLTHFALLLVNEPIKIDEGEQEITNVENKKDDSFLNDITIIGGILSISGILGIYVTAILFPTWREKPGTQILLHLSTVILLETILLQFTDSKVFLKTKNRCELIGILLHYVEISKFCWMLIYAFLQYLRFVKVLGGVPKNLVLKSMLFGWGFAIIPAGVTLYFAPERDLITTKNCYLSGNTLFYAVVVPTTIVVILNVAVFIMVMFHVTRRKLETTELKFTILQVYLAVLLFFVLGLPYVFGLLNVYISNPILKDIFLYTFNCTAIFQGLILFIFYVVFNSETRGRWKKFLCGVY